MNLKSIWKNRKKIYEGIKNSVIRDVFVEDISKKRMFLCNQCPSKGDDCEVPGTAPCCKAGRGSTPAPTPAGRLRRRR
jgi:hypothetical protein